jgi:hypothetical protein
MRFFPFKEVRMRSRTLARLQDLERALLPRREIKKPPVEVITATEDENGNIIEGADRLPGGENYRPGGPKLHIRIIKTPERADREA